MSINPTILIVEDNWEVRELLKVILTGKGFEVREAETGLGALDACEIQAPDLVVLDLTLPDIDGLEVCKKMKALLRMKGVPIIICSARTMIFDKLKGFEIGADDYISKPFDPEELVARIRVQFRKTGQDFIQSRKMFQSGKLKLDPQKFQAFYLGIKIAGLTRMEFELLYLLARRSPETVSRTEISKLILGKDHSEESRAIDMHVALLRRKLGGDLSKKVVTVSGKGYLWSKIQA